VLATTHAHWTARLTAGRAWSAWAVAGSVAPDAPALVRAAWVLGGRRTSREDALGRIYHEPPWREIHLAAHAAWAPVVAAAVAGALGAGDVRARALALGWAGHLAVDYVTHHDDAWPPGLAAHRRALPGAAVVLAGRPSRRRPARRGRRAVARGRRPPADAPERARADDDRPRAAPRARAPARTPRWA
jgi:hypothetical protein